MFDSDSNPQSRSNPNGMIGDQDSDLAAAIYARTSSSKQKYGHSIDEQIRRCWNRCETMDWKVRYVFADEAESGRDIDRPEFQRLLETVEGGGIDVVVFWALDRFCRSLVDLVNIEETLSENEVGLQSVTEHIDTTTPVGRFNFRNLASAAELETDLTSRRVKMGMYGLAQQNKWPNSDPPLGYDLKKNGKLDVNESEAELVREIFRMYVNEKSMPQVAFRLNEEGHCTKTGEEWCTQSVSKVLRNELYMGSYSVAGYEEHVEEYRIIADETFEEVADIRFRFQSSQGMDQDRKEAKADRILRQFKEGDVD